MVQNANEWSIVQNLRAHFGFIPLVNNHYEHLLFSPNHSLNRMLKSQLFEKRVRSCCSADWIQRSLPVHTPQGH